RIDAGCVLGDGVIVGNDVHLYPQVTCYTGTVIGDRVMIHSGTRLGADGFGYLPGKGGALPRKIPQVGRCVIGDDVEIGANTTVDRGSVDDTIVGRGTKIDNLVMVAHNVRIGERCLIAAMVGIAGSTRVGDDVFLAGQVGLADHINVGSRVRITVQSGVIGDIEDGATVTGYPARNHREYLRAQAALYRLAPLVNELEALARPEGDSDR
ncbi:MAG TPA: UDP-3-O-(3-hydroxymyristoyl)glucosamine N-acyltransferase, partial [Gemmatimonadales bacterium]